MHRYALALLLLGCSAGTPAPAPTPTPAAPTAAATPVAETPVAEAPPPREDLDQVLTARYEAMAYAYTTRDLEKVLDFTAEKAYDHGKPISRAELKKGYEEDFADQARNEEEAGESLRFSLVNKILKVTEKGPGQVLARVRTTTRMRTKDGFYVIEEIIEDTDHWVKEKDGVWRIADTTDEKLITATKTINGKVTPLN